MLREEKVILMTKMACYEQGEGKKDISIGNYFRGDYIAVQLLKSVIRITLAFAICVLLYVVYSFENFMQEMYKVEWFTLAKQMVIYYGISVMIYGVLSYCVYSYRYTKAKKSLKWYYEQLKTLNSLYKK